MRAPFFQVDAFAARRFTGNPAAVLILGSYPADEPLQAVAAENNLAETAFRYFAPAKGIPEDPVTGGAHCLLAPFWAGRLGRTAFRAYQASRRGGEVRCGVAGDRVTLAGSCAFYLHGEIEI